jgi:hypothetical protein
MTIPSETSRSGPYTGNGVTSVFDYDFKIQSPRHIIVLASDLSGAEAVLTLDVDYTVSGVGSSAGGQVTLTSPLPSGHKLLLVINVPFTQEVDLENQGAYYAETVEGALDLSAQRDLQLKDGVDRSWKTFDGQGGRLRAGPNNGDALVSDGAGNLVPGLNLPGLDSRVFVEVAERIAGDKAVASLIGGNYSMERPDYDSRTAFALASVSAFRTSVRTGGFVASGDGGAGLYRRVVSEPSHPGKVQSADGGWWELAEARVTPFQFGAFGNASGAVGNGADDTAAIQAMLDYVAAKTTSTSRAVASFQGGRFRITDTVIAGYINIAFDGGEIHYDGPRDRAAFQVGTSDSGFNYEGRWISDAVINSTAVSWGNEDYVGLRVYNARRCSFDIRQISGFANGLQGYSLYQGWAYNKVFVGHLLHNRVALDLVCDGNGGGADYANQNSFFAGRYGQTSATNGLGNCYGVRFRAINGGYNGHNNNIWYAPCFELQNGSPGDERIPFLLDDCGRKNRCHDARWETGRGYFARLAQVANGQMFENIFNCVYMAASGGEIEAVLQEGKAYNNYLYRTFPRETQIGFDDLASLASAYNSTQMQIGGGLVLVDSSSANIVRSNTGFEIFQRSLRYFAARGIGFFLNADHSLQYWLRAAGPDGFGGRWGVACFDAQMNRIADSGTPMISTGTWTSTYGGCYRPGSDSPIFNFRIYDTNVAYVLVFFSGGTNAAVVNGLKVSLTGGATTMAPLYRPVFLGAEGRKATANPGGGIVGRYQAGDFIANAAPASGQPTGWGANVGGWLAPAWAADTAYLAGHLRLNDTDKIYECVTAGTSASSGGPTGTGSGVTDGTAVWNYLGPKATFIAGPNY